MPDCPIATIRVTVLSTHPGQTKAEADGLGVYDVIIYIIFIIFILPLVAMGIMVILSPAFG